MKKRIICAVLVFVLFFSTMVFMGMKLKAQDTPVLYVDPPTSQVAVNEVFSVNVSVAYVTDLQAVGFRLGFNTTLLNATACYKVTDPPDTIWGPVDPVTLEWTPLQNVSAGFVCVVCVYALAHAQNGDITVVTINFTALATGGSTLHLYDTELCDPSAEPIAHTTQDGSVTVVACMMGTRVNVVPSTDVAVAGQLFTTNITVSNVTDLCLWAFSISWNPATLDLMDVTEGDFLARGGSTTGVLIKEINQTGGYMKEATCSLLGSVPGVNCSGTLATITFEATAVGSSPLDMYFCDLLDSSGESISFNVTDSSVDIDAPELSITNVSLPYPGQSLYVNTTVSVNATIQNSGNFSASAFNVSVIAYWDEGEIVDYFGKLTVDSLEPNTTQILQFTFTLHNSGNYTLTFKVDCDGDVIEVSETNNELALAIKVKMQGDIDGDHEVTYLDLFDLSRAYWSTPEDENWDPYADINNDGKVDHNDLFLLAQNYSST